MKARGKDSFAKRPRGEQGKSKVKGNADGHQKSNGFPVVGIGASAGGYEAVTKFLEKLPEDTGMAFVLIQHLDPTHESRLSDLLRRTTKLRVVEVKRACRVERNHFYVIPPNKNLVITHGRLEPSPRRKSEMPPMPVDYFLRSLAEAQNHNAIGVILSGNGSDGTMGLEAIKGADGITFAQAPASAKYPGMPGSAIASGCVDFILPPNDIAAELAKLPLPLHLDGAPTEKPVPGADHAMMRIYAVLRTASGVDFSHYKQTTLKRRIARRMIVHRISGMPEYLKFLHTHPAEVDALAEDVLITVTRFFRDPKSLQVLVKKVFPALLERRPSGKPIRIWVPGCSSGEEVYSLTILLAEYLGHRIAEYPVQIFGTDISETAVTKARAGFYKGNIALDVSPARLKRFFTPADDGYRIAKSLRDQCVFARQDLGADPPFSQLDLISCQNVLIYFGQELQRRVLPVFHYALKPYGFLALGSAESLSGLGELFTQVDAKQRVFMKTSPHGHQAAPSDLRTPAPDHSPRGKRRPAPPPEESEPREPVFPHIEKLADRVLLRHYGPNGVVTDARMQVLQFRGNTTPFLEHKPGAANLNLLKLLHDDLVVPVRTAAAKALHHQSPARKEIVWNRTKTQQRLLKLTVIPFRTAPNREQMLLVLFEEGVRLAAAAPPKAARSTKGDKPAATTEVHRLREELEATRESLQAIIEEQEATNEELRSANEESQSSNEELQSTNEELETAKEEMQSTNEELSTVNDELHSTNAECTRINNDLLNLLSSIQVPIVMVDNELLVRRFTPAAQRFFSLIPSDIGRSLSDIKVKLDLPDLDKLIHEVVETLHMTKRQVQDGQGRWFSLEIRAYRTKDNRIDGAVLSLLDIDILKRGLDHIGEVLWDPFLALTQELRVVKANQAFYEKFDVRARDTEGQYLYDLGNGQWNIPRLRKLLGEILPTKSRIRDFLVEHQFPQLGQRKMLLNARELQAGSPDEKLILLAFRDVTDSNGKS